MDYAKLQQMMANTDDAPAKPRYRPDPVAQAAELRARLGRINNPPSLKPGDIVRSVRGVGQIKDESRMVLIVVRNLDMTSDYDRALADQYLANNENEVGAIPPDLVLGEIMSAQGSMVVFHVYPSCMFEKLSDDDLAAWGDSSASP